MTVLVDTPILSLAVRRRVHQLSSADVAIVEEWHSLVRAGEAAIPDMVRQELLSGVRSEQQFDHMRELLRAYPSLPPTIEDFGQAAACYNRCRANGIQGSAFDFLICAVAIRLD